MGKSSFKMAEDLNRHLTEKEGQMARKRKGGAAQHCATAKIK